MLLSREELLRPFPADSNGPLDVVGYDQRPDGLLAVVTVRFEAGRLPRRILELWRGESLEQAVLLPELNLPAGYGRLGDRVEFDPSGREVAVAFPGAGKEMVVVDLRTRTDRARADEPARVRVVSGRHVVRPLDGRRDPGPRARAGGARLRPAGRRRVARVALSRSDASGVFRPILHTVCSPS